MIAMLEPISIKRCIKCGEEKALTAYSQNSRNRDGLETQCKDCRRGGGRTREKFIQRTIDAPLKALCYLMVRADMAAAPGGKLERHIETAWKIFRGWQDKNRCTGTVKVEDRGHFRCVRVSGHKGWCETSIVVRFDPKGMLQLSKGYDR